MQSILSVAYILACQEDVPTLVVRADIIQLYTDRFQCLSSLPSQIILSYEKDYCGTSYGLQKGEIFEKLSPETIFTMCFFCSNSQKNLRSLGL